MFDTSSQPAIRTKPAAPEDDGLPDADALRRHILDPATLWVTKRRAHLPYRPPQRLPRVARGG